jgi:hypothetical protein
MANMKSTTQASKHALNADKASVSTKARTTSSATHKTKVFQVLVRLPEDVATRFVQVVKPGQRNSYFLELLRRDLDRESNELAQAAQALTALEAKDSKLHKEDAAWLNAALLKRDPKVRDDIGNGMGDDDVFDATEFERQYQVAKQKREAKNTTKTAATTSAATSRDKARTPTRRRQSLQAA